MTIRNIANYCPTCEEVCWHHPTNCTICGRALEAAPTSVGHSNEISNHPTEPGISPIPDTLREETRASSRELNRMLQNIRRQIQVTGVEQQELLAEVQSLREQWETVPAALLDPQLGNANNSASRPTSKAFLEKINRITLQNHSSLLYKATLIIDGLSRVDAIMGDFDVEIKPQVQSANLIIAEPRTGLGGVSPKIKALAMDKKSHDLSSGLMICFERGDGVTFVQKALMAQEIGATACIIANNAVEPWPYIMKDSTGEALKAKGGLHIPTVMVKREDANRIWNLDKKNSASARLEISQPAQQCVICTDTIGSGSTVMQLPVCGHIFHQDCVLQWLTKHNTCPFCRREFPTDDEDYEKERRQMQRTHAGSSGTGGADANPDFYG